MAGSPRLRFLLPLAEPDVHVSAHPALHKTRWSSGDQGFLQRSKIPGFVGDAACVPTDVA